MIRTPTAPTPSHQPPNATGSFSGVSSQVYPTIQCAVEALPNFFFGKSVELVDKAAILAVYLSFSVAQGMDAAFSGKFDETAANVQISLKNSKEFKEWHRDMEDFLDEAINASRKLLACFADIVHRATGNERLREYISVVQSFDYFRDRLNVASKVERINLVSWGLREMSQLLLNFGREDNGDGFSLNESMSKAKHAKELARKKLLKKQPSANDATEYFEEHNHSGFLPELSRSGRRSVDIAGARGIPRTSTHQQPVQRLDRRRSTSKSDRGERPERVLGSLGHERPTKDVRVEDIVLEDSSHRDGKAPAQASPQREPLPFQSAATFDGTRRSQHGTPKALPGLSSAHKDRPMQDFKKVETEVMTRTLKHPRAEDAVRAGAQDSGKDLSSSSLKAPPPLDRLVVPPLSLTCEREHSYKKAVVHPLRVAVPCLELAQIIEAGSLQFHKRRSLEAATANRTVECAYKKAPPVFDRHAVECTQATRSAELAYLKAPPVFPQVPVPGLEACRALETARFELPPKIVVRPEQPAASGSGKKQPQKEPDSAVQTKPTTGSEQTARGEDEEAFNVARVTQPNAGSNLLQPAVENSPVFHSPPRKSMSKLKVLSAPGAPAPKISPHLISQDSGPG